MMIRRLACYEQLENAKQKLVPVFRNSFVYLGEEQEDEGVLSVSAQ